MERARNADIIRVIGATICGLGDVLIELADTGNGPEAIAGLEDELRQLMRVLASEGWTE